MEPDFKHTLSQDPDNVVALNGLGYFLTIRTTRFKEAHALIQRAYELRPNDPAIIDSMGWIEFKLGRLSRAIELLEKAYGLFPDPEVAAHLAEVLWAAEKKDRAKTVLRDTLEQHPEAPEILEIIQRLGISL